MRVLELSELTEVGGANPLLVAGAKCILGGYSGAAAQTAAMAIAGSGSACQIGVAAVTGCVGAAASTPTAIAAGAVGTIAGALCPSTSTNNGNDDGDISASAF